MANELTIDATIKYEDGDGVADSIDLADLIGDSLKVTLLTTKMVKYIQSIATSETALKLGDIATLGFAILVNIDPTNYVDVKVAASGAIFARLRAAGGVCLLQFGSGAQVPVAVANSGACKVAILIAST